MVDYPPIETLSIIFALVNAVSAVIVQTFDHPKEKYYSIVQDIQEDRWHDVCGELGPAISDLVTFVRDSNDYSIEQLEDPLESGPLLRQALNGRDDLGEIEEKIELLDEPKQKYRTCWRAQRRAIWFFILGFLSCILLVASLFLMNQSQTSVGVQTLLGAIAVFLFTTGIWQARKASNAESWLDDAAAETDFI